MELYMELASRGEAIRGYQMQGGYWRDIGRVEDYMDLHRDLLGEKGKSVIHPEASLAEDVRIEGFISVGKRTSIKAGAFIKDSIIWDEVEIEAGSSVEGCVVGDRAQVKGKHRGEVLIPG